MSTAMQVVQAPIQVTRYPGGHKLVGTTTTPDGAVSRRVHLYREMTPPEPGNIRHAPLAYVASQRSDAATGAYEFTHISDDYTYTLRSFDSTGTYDPVFVGGKIPEPM